MKVPGIRYVQGRNYTRNDSGEPVVTAKHGIALHNTANNASAENEADYATRRTDDVSSHFYVDHDSIIQSLDTDWRAWHAGSVKGNDNAVSIEITGKNHRDRQWWLENVAWDKLAAPLALLCQAYDIQVRRATVAEMKSNPQVQAFYSHDDMRLAWGGTTHTDPGPNFPWEHLFDRVRAAMIESDPAQLAYATAAGRS